MKFKLTQRHTNEIYYVRSCGELFNFDGDRKHRIYCVEETDSYVLKSYIDVCCSSRHRDPKYLTNFIIRKEGSKYILEKFYRNGILDYDFDVELI